MGKLLKFLHTIGAIGLMGGMAALLVLLSVAPPPTLLAEYALLRGAMGTIATWIFLPSLGLTLIAGLLAIAVNRGFHNAGWAWVKAASGILVFESGFVGVLGPMQREAERSAKALAGQVDPATLAASLGAAGAPPDRIHPARGNGADRGPSTARVTLELGRGSVAAVAPRNEPRRAKAGRDSRSCPP